MRCVILVIILSLLAAMCIEHAVVESKNGSSPVYVGPEGL